jgi:hypothetical protein
VEAAIAVAEEDAAAAVVAVEDAGDKGTVDEEKPYENKTTYYDFVESFSDCLRDR